MARQADHKHLDVRVPEGLQRGVYANNLVVGHTKEEFIIDFILLANDDATLNARVITSPGHMKRMLAALEQNVEQYELKFGPIDEGETLPSAGGTPPPMKH